MLELALKLAHGGSNYQLRVELGQARLALAIKDQKSINHGNRLTLVILCEEKEGRRGDIAETGSKLALLDSWLALLGGAAVVSRCKLRLDDD